MILCYMNSQIQNHHQSCTISPQTAGRAGLSIYCVLCFHSASHKAESSPFFMLLIHVYCHPLSLVPFNFSARYSFQNLIKVLDITKIFQISGYYIFSLFPPFHSNDLELPCLFFFSYSWNLPYSSSPLFLELVLFFLFNPHFKRSQFSIPFSYLIYILDNYNKL